MTTDGRMAEWMNDLVDISFGQPGARRCVFTVDEAADLWCLTVPGARARLNLLRRRGWVFMIRGRAWPKQVSADYIVTRKGAQFA